MKKTLFAAAFSLTLAVGSVAIQSPASAGPAWLAPAPNGSGASTLISTVAATATPRTQTQVVPQPQESQQPQEYPKYHDSPTATYLSPPGKNTPCHFTQANVEGKMRQVEICD